MDIVDYLITHISPLPWTIKGTGLGLMVLLMFRAFTQFLSLRFIRAATSLVTALVVVLIMARYGQDIAAFLATQSTTETASGSQG